jgi:two-component system sensor histidine kinase/response regulator
MTETTAGADGAPAEDVRPDADPGSPARPPDPGVRGRVLLVDDNEANRAVAVGMLAVLRCSADVAVDGHAAVEAVAREAYGLVLMDCKMPGMDGFQATAEIRRREGAAGHIPIIAMTAGDRELDWQRCLAAGMDDYIVKPVTLVRIKAALARWLGEPATTDVVDRGRLAALMELDKGGDGEGLLASLVHALLAGAPGDLAKLSAAIEREDGGALRDVAHRLKGAAATVGIARLPALCEQLEALAAAGAFDAARNVLGRVADELGRTRSALGAAMPRR